MCKTSFWIIRITFFGLALVQAHFIKAQEPEIPIISKVAQTPPDLSPPPDSPYALKRKLDKPRGYFFPPLYSFIIPGLDQWIEGQFIAAGAYSGAAFLGANLISIDAKKRTHLKTFSCRAPYQP
jgi:hypothetical protein